MISFPRRSAAIVSSAIGLMILSGCGLTSKLPSVNLPFVGSEGPLLASDPEIPYSINDKIAPGHTLKVSIFAGQRSPGKLFRGDVVVDENGDASFGDFGKIKVAGLDATGTWRAINSLFNRKRGEKIITVQLESIEGQRVVVLTGAVKRPSVVQWFDGVNAANALTYVGGLKAEGHSVYVLHEGKKAYFPNLAAAASAGELAPGDIVDYSGEL